MEICTRKDDDAKSQESTEEQNEKESGEKVAGEAAEANDVEKKSGAQDEENSRRTRTGCTSGGCLCNQFYFR